MEFRRAQLKKLYDAIDKMDAELTTALHADLRKSAAEAHMTEIGMVLSEIRHAIRHLPAGMRRQHRRSPWLAWPAKSWIQPEPFGVTLIIGAWNYPVQLLMLPLVGAIAAGNCAVIKPSELAPNTSAVIAKLIAGTFPGEYLAVIEGDPSVSEDLLREKFDKIFFTGSSNTGRDVMAAAARHLTPITLELGGKCPVIVCDDVPIDITARRIAWGKFMNAGQTCVAPEYILADRRIHAALVEAIKRAIREFHGEDPQKSPEYGRIINRKHFDRLIGYDATVTHDAADLYIAPTILKDVQPNSPVMQEEIFGPILPILSFENIDQAITELRDRPAPLALYLFTNDRATQQRVLGETRSGGVCINDTILHMIGKHLPLGGLGDSGMGNYHGEATFKCFTHFKSVMKRSVVIDSKLRYPPMRISLAMLKRACRFLLR